MRHCLAGLALRVIVAPAASAPIKAKSIIVPGWGCDKGVRNSQVDDDVLNGRLAVAGVGGLRSASSAVAVGGSMSRGLGLLVIVVAAFIIMMGVFGVWAGIAEAFPTTEEAFFKIGSVEISGVFLVILGAVSIVVGYFLVRFAGSLE
jgi:hypothetical protein